MLAGVPGQRDTLSRAVIAASSIDSRRINKGNLRYPLFGRLGSSRFPGISPKRRAPEYFLIARIE